jgi:hypothetical protein
MLGFAHAQLRRRAIVLATASFTRSDVGGATNTARFRVRRLRLRLLRVDAAVGGNGVAARIDTA